MKVGIMLPLTDDVEGEFKKAYDIGITSGQVVCWEQARLSDENAARVKAASVKFGVEISSFWCGWDGPTVWDAYDGQLTLGLVPPTYRFERMKNLMRGADFAVKLGVKHLVTHVGFIPENPNDSDYHGVISALRVVAGYCKAQGLYFLFETGQETPVTLLRAIEDIGLDNLGVNLDPANLILYGRGNPIDALDVLGPYVRDVHAKDGNYPTSGHRMGEETPLGQGKVNVPAFLRRLKEIGYDGPLTIEREISGPEQIRDIRAGKELLEKLIAAL